jgi:nitrite reductase (NADH) large subunit
MRHLIVGSGVAGVTAAQAIVRADPSAQVHIFGAEPHPYYQRPRLWKFIAGQIDQDALYFRPPTWYAERGIHLHLGKRVTAVDLLAHRLTLIDGSRMEYDRLLLATGGRSFVPPFDGADKKGVFTLRTLEDALAIKEHAQRSAKAIVIGGGLLGLETAHALLSLGLETSVIEFMPRLLPRQLDEEGAQVLQSRLEEMGLRILTGAATQAILGDGRATGVQLKASPESFGFAQDELGRRASPEHSRRASPEHSRRASPEHSRRDENVIDGELVLISTGIRSRVELARQAGLEVNRGIVVDEQLRTSVADVYAAGDVAEFEGVVYGIIPAAIEQAQVAAANMVADPSTFLRQVHPEQSRGAQDGPLRQALGPQAQGLRAQGKPLRQNAGQGSGRGDGATYSGTVPATTLKIVGIDLTSLGEATTVGDEFVILRQADPRAGIYRRLTLRDGKIVGAILLGDTRSVQPLKQLIAAGRDVSTHGDRLLNEGFDLRALARG